MASESRSCVMVDVHNVDYSITLAWLPGPKGIRERLPKSHLSVSVWCVYMPLGQSSRQAKERGGLAPPAAASAVLLSPLVDGDGNPRTFHLCSVPRSIAPSWTHRLGCPGLSNPAHQRHQTPERHPSHHLHQTHPPSARARVEAIHTPVVSGQSPATSWLRRPSHVLVLVLLFSRDLDAVCPCLVCCLYLLLSLLSVQAWISQLGLSLDLRSSFHHCYPTLQLDPPSSRFQSHYILLAPRCVSSSETTPPRPASTLQTTLSTASPTLLPPQHTPSSSVSQQAQHHSVSTRSSSRNTRPER